MPSRSVLRATVALFIFTTQFGFAIFAAPARASHLQPTTESSSAAEAKVLRVQRSLDTMGTTFTVDAYGNSLGVLESATEQAFDEVLRLNGMLSNYIPDSELSRVNRRAADSPVRVSKEFFDILQECIGYSRLSDGVFDITVGTLMQTWGFYKGSGHLPHRAEVRYALSNVGYEYIDLNPLDYSVHFLKSGLNLDPGGVGKGLAVDRMAAILRAHGIRSALISGGGSSVFAIGAPPDDPRGWIVKLRDPKNKEKTAGQLYLNNDSVSTSGNYEKFFWAEGKLYSHIMDPRTGYPSNGMLAVSVVTPRTIDSEVWAKPFYILGRTWANFHKPANFHIFMCEDRPGAHCEWLP